VQLWEVVVIGVAVLIGSIVKSVTGMGLPIIALPIISAFVGPETGIAVLAIPAVAQNIGIVVRHRDARRGTRGLLVFCLTGSFGAVIGTLTLGVVPEDVTLGALALIIAVWLVQRLRHPDLTVDPARVGVYGPMAGLLAGAFQGGAGVSGPVVAAWHLALRIDREAFVFSIATAFGLIGIVQTATLAQQGLLDGRLGVSALLTAMVVATVPLGGWMRSRLSGPTFDRMVVALVSVSCAGLLIEIISHQVG
jgi:uncharacterized membrane protein YfcA